MYLSTLSMKGKSAMGLSASQARLLSITARLTHNETRSQLITNSKLRLADKSSEASKEYMEALNSTKLVYANYDSTGTRQTQALTVGAVTQYSDIKNQYGFVDSAGRLLVSAEDAKNYQNSGNLAAFLSCYEIGDMANPKYDPALEDIYGEDFNKFYNEGDPHSWLNTVSGATSGAIGQMVTGGGTQPSFSENLLHDEAAYNQWVQNLKDSVKNIDTGGNQTKGLFNTWVDSITDVPEFEPEPTAPNKPTEPTKPTFPDFSALATAYNSSQCYSSVDASTSGIGHMEHNLAALIWGEGGMGEGTCSVTNSSGTITVDRDVAINYGYVSLTNYGFSDTQSSKDLADALNEYADEYPQIEDIKQAVIDLYCEVINYLEKNGGVGGSTTDLDSSRYTLSSSSGSKSASELVTQWNDFYNQLKNFETLEEEMEKEWEEEVWKPYLEQLDVYNKKYAEYQEQYDKWHDDFIGGLNTWYEQMQNTKNAYTEALDNLPAKTVPDEENPKYQWYTNLWFRMGGISEAEKQDNQNNYKILEDYYMYNENWLQFALEHGIVTMEQVQYQEEGETLVEQMNQYAWVSVQYGNCADFYEEQDDVAIAKAEAEYNRKTTEIQAKDKKYDTDLKKLDTEHNALQTEYDSIKSIIKKNVERSFKAFS